MRGGRSVLLQRTEWGASIFFTQNVLQYIHCPGHQSCVQGTQNQGRGTICKLFSIYKPDLFRPILYKTVTRASVALCLCLLWQRFVSDGTYTIWEAPCLAVGAIFLGWAWVSYLRLDGIRIPFVDRGRLSTERGQRRRGTHTMADFADEKIVSFDELSPEEKSFCSMLSSLVLGVPMTVIGLLAGVL